MEQSQIDQYRIDQIQIRIRSMIFEQECCSCCKLGSMVSESGLPCEIPHHYGPDCRASFSRCCNNQTLNLAKAISVVMETGVTTEVRPVQGKTFISLRILLCTQEHTQRHIQAYTCMHALLYTKLYKHNDIIINIRLFKTCKSTD